jgi:hypothetical protein
MQEPATSLCPVLDGFVKLGQEHREQKGLGTGFHKDIRGFFLKSLARRYWNPTRRYMSESGWSVAKACKAAGLDPSTHTRWDEMVPNLETICLLFARCDLDMKGVPFPTGHEAFKAALLKTVEHIRSSYLGEQPAQLDEEALECLRQVLRSQAVLETIKEIEKLEAGDAKGVKERLRQAAEVIAEELSKRFTAGLIKHAAGVQRVITDWLTPLVLFYTVILPAQRGS